VLFERLREQFDLPALAVDLGDSCCAELEMVRQQHESAEATGDAVTDLAQRIGAGQLAEQDADELRPTGETTCATFSLMFPDDADELGPEDLLKKLTERSSAPYHGSVLLSYVVNRLSRYPTLQHRRRTVKSQSSEG
jgi:hypothetical protein